MNQMFKSFQFKTMLSYFLLAISVILAYKLVQHADILTGFISQIMTFISPFIYGFVLAYILNIPCVGIQKLLLKTNIPWIGRRSKLLSVLFTYLLMIFIVYLILRLVIPSVTKSITLFATSYESYVDRIESFITYINHFEVINIDINRATISTYLQDFVREKLPEYYNQDFVLKKLSESINIIVGVSSALLKGFLTFISSIYILFEKENFKRYLNKLLYAFFPKTFLDIALRYTGDLNKNFKQYIYTQTIDGCILGSIATLELLLFRSPYALILGIMLGIVNYIPYFGSIFGSLGVVVIIAFTQNFQIAGIAAVILLITQQIDGNIIQPKLMGESFSLSPLLVIISITVGGKFYGIFGMLVAIPIVAVIKNMLDEVIAYSEKRISMHGNAPDE